MVRYMLTKEPAASQMPTANQPNANRNPQRAEVLFAVVRPYDGSIVDRDQKGGLPTIVAAMRSSRNAA
jgi:hypothetical protein